MTVGFTNRKEVLVVTDSDGAKHLECPECHERDEFQDYEDVLAYRNVCISDDGQTLFVDAESRYVDEGTDQRLCCQSCDEVFEYPSGVDDVEYVGDAFAAAEDEEDAE